MKRLLGYPVVLLREQVEQRKTRHLLEQIMQMNFYVQHYKRMEYGHCFGLVKAAKTKKYVLHFFVAVIREK